MLPPRPTRPLNDPGRDDVEPVVLAFRSAFPHMAITVHEIVGDAGRAGVRAEIIGTPTGEWFGKPTTGKAVRIPLHGFHHLGDGNITHTRHLQDRFGCPPVTSASVSATRLMLRTWPVAASGCDGGDFTDAAALPAAFEGATQVLIVSSGATDGTTTRQHGTAIDAAKAAGARRIVYTSHMGSNPASHFPPMRNHAATEGLLQACGVPFVSLRNGFYPSSMVWLLGRAPETGEIVAPADGPVSWTAHADLAEAAAVALTDAGTFDGFTTPLTGSAALVLAAVAPIVSEVVGRPVKRATPTDEACREMLAARGTPKQWVDTSVGLFAASRAGEFAAVDTTLERLLGRPPQSVRDVWAIRFGKQ